MDRDLRPCSRVNLAIIGGGLVGASLALALQAEDKAQLIVLLARMKDQLNDATAR